MTLSSFALFAAAATPAPGSAFQSILPILLMIPIFYVIIIRPQQKRQKELKALISSLKTGDKIVTTTGLHGIVANVKEKTFLLKVADNVKLEFDKASVGLVEARADSTSTSEA